MLLFAPFCVLWVFILALAAVFPWSIVRGFSIVFYTFSPFKKLFPTPGQTVTLEQAEQEMYPHIEQGRRHLAAPSSYGVIIKLSRVETLVNNTSVVRIHQDGSSFSSCNRRSGTEVTGVGVALHQAQRPSQVHMVSSPASDDGSSGNCSVEMPCFSASSKALLRIAAAS